MHYDYLIVGAGLFGAVVAHEMTQKGRKCLVIDRREHIAGNIYTEDIAGIQVHKYGAHIFHTSDRKIWEYINQFAEFNRFVNSPMAIYEDEIYNMPFNMNTFSKMWGVRTPEEARKKIDSQIRDLNITEPENLEEQALLLVGRDIYEKLVKGYTEKQWGRACTELPAFIIQRLPLRFTYDNNYFNDRYQGIPIGGYTAIIEKMLEGIPVLTGTDYKEFRKRCGSDRADDLVVSGTLNAADGKKIFGSKTDGSMTFGSMTFGATVYTGMIDEYFDYQLGSLEYRSLRFEEELIPDCENYQGNAVINYTEREIPYTRIIEHKHFDFGTQKDTVITREYPLPWKPGDEPYYPVNNAENEQLLKAYQKLAKQEEHVWFGGRLGQYRYYDMDKVIAAALEMAGQLEP